MLSVRDLSYRIEGRPLFEGANVTVNGGENVGLVGRNGSGKSTLLKLISGELQPDGGAIQVPTNSQIGYIRQEAPAGDKTLLETVLAADSERARLLAEAETAEDPDRIAEIHMRLSDIDAHSAEARAARILSGLGFSDAAQQRPCKEFSGGWRMRVALAALLFSEPDVLLLDEPTNHLDLEATMWLEGYLRDWSGTMLLVSHDRRLLNKCVDKIAHLKGGTVTTYQGGYDRFEETRREQLRRQQHMHEEREKERARIQKFVDRFRAKAGRASQAQSRIKMLERMQPIGEVQEDKAVRFDFPQPDELPPPLIALDHVDVGYDPDNPILRQLNHRIDQDDRIALLGANGNGKTTFARLLALRLQPLKGKFTTPGKLRIGYFSQDQADELDLAHTPVQHMAEVMPNANKTQVRAHLGRFGFTQEKADVAVGNLSGGEKARLLFALMTRHAPHLLILDEPTNHLDIEARQALIEALNEFAGAVVLITHDPHLIQLVVDRLWIVADRTAKQFDGDLEAYRQQLLEQRRAERAAAKRQQDTQKDKAQAGGGNAKDDGLSKKERRKQAAEAREQTKQLRNEAKKIEREIEKLSEKQREIEAKLADPKVYNGPTADLQDLQVAHGKVKDQLAKAEERWLELQEQLEETG
jgi:ATP-binding cassette subfamily F protein 3